MMKPLFIAFCAMGLALGFDFAATAQTTPPVAPAPPATPAVATPAIPPDKTSTTPDNARYLTNPDLLMECEAQLATFNNNKPCDMIFIGDSITEGWIGGARDLWKKYYVPRRALDFGIGGDKTQNVLWRLNNMDIQNLKPKVAVIMIGTNNLDNTAHEIADGVKAVVANTQAAFPGVKIILVSIMPNQRANDKMMQVNSIIKSYADNSTVYYLDLVPLMPPVTTTTPDGKTVASWKGLCPDLLHPDITGYQIWADAMEPLVTKLLPAGQ